MTGLLSGSIKGVVNSCFSESAEADNAPAGRFVHAIVTINADMLPILQTFPRLLPVKNLGKRFSAGHYKGQGEFQIN